MVRWLIAISLLSTTAFAKDKLVATPLNSPVKETFLKVKLEGFDSISGVLFKPKNGESEVSGELIKDGNAFIGKFKASFLKPGNYEYRVKVKTTSGDSQKDEASSVAFVSFAVDSSLEVADPGDEGKKTLVGIDIDNNGVRDDVQRWINEFFSDKTKVKQAMKQYARGIQDTYINKDNKPESIKASYRGLRAQDCSGYAQIDAGYSYKNISENNMKLRAIMANTVDRIYAKEKVSNNFHGQVIDRISREDACDFSL